MDSILHSMVSDTTIHKINVLNMTKHGENYLTELEPHFLSVIEHNYSFFVSFIYNYTIILTVSEI